MPARSRLRVRHALALAAALVMIIGAFVWLEPERDLVRTDDVAPAPTVEFATAEVVAAEVAPAELGSGVRETRQHLVDSAADLDDSSSTPPTAAERLELVVRVEEVGTPPDTFDGLIVRLLHFDEHGAVSPRQRRVVEAGRVVFRLPRASVYGVQFEGDLARLGRVPLALESAVYEASTPWIVPRLWCGEPSTEIVAVPPMGAQLVVDPGPFAEWLDYCVVADVGSSRVNGEFGRSIDANGVFVFERLTPGSKRVSLARLGPPLDGFRPAPIDIELEAAETGRVAFLRNALRFDITGRVVWSDGLPAADVPVLAYHVESDAQQRSGVRPFDQRSGGGTVRSGVDGRFMFRDVDAEHLRSSPHANGAVEETDGWAALAENPPVVDLIFDASTPKVVDVGDLVIVRARPIEIRGRISVAGLEPNTVKGFVATRDPALRAPNAIASVWPFRVDADGSFSRTVEGNLPGGVVWLELKHALSDRRIGPLAVVVEGQASVDLGLLTW